MTKNNATIVLASSSPRRIEMFKNNGFEPIIIKPECEESLPKSIGMEDAVMLLSLRKALEVEELIKSGRLTGEQKEGLESAESDIYIIAADTIVYHNKIIGKPFNRCHAEEILTDLSGKVHYVVTGVSILKYGEPVRKTFAEVSEVHFKDYKAEDLREYLDTDEPYDKAGAYAIQGYFSKYIDRVVGDYNNIVGFPWERFIKEFT